MYLKTAEGILIQTSTYIMTRINRPRAGFKECGLVSIDYPASIAVVGFKDI